MTPAELRAMLPKLAMAKERERLAMNAGKAPVNPFAGAVAGPVPVADQITPARAITATVIQNDKAANRVVRR